MKITNNSRIRFISIATLITGITAFLGTVDVSAHGYVSLPKSRVLVCKENNPDNPTLPACIAAKAVTGYGYYDATSIGIGGVRDNHQQFVPDGKLCSANNSNYAGLDLARNDWQTTLVQAGETEFVWTHVAAYHTKYIRYYITKEGFDPSAAPLKWSDLEEIYQSPSARQARESRHVVNLPARTSKHIVYSIWQRDWTDAPEAYYQCVDVEFSPPTSSSSTTSRSSASSSSVSDLCSGLPTWNISTVYTRPQQVKYNNKRYQANYWTRGNNPEQSSGQYNVWLDLGACVATSAASSSVIVLSSSSSKSAISSSSSRSSSGPVIDCFFSPYTPGVTYQNNSIVSNNGINYRCVVGNWCSIGGPYAPGTGWAWPNAWVVHICPQ